ncbi:MAG: twin-arginine translocase subunit TatC [Thermodesulfovibrionales bacterium]|nr:twin-arginine translocase subunit TatC [Thermodesulfovibrionales bacterium]
MESRVAEEKMSLTGHLSELRNAIITSLVAFAAGVAVSFNFSEQILGFLTLPMRSDLVLKPSYPFVSFLQRAGEVPKLVFLAPSEAFWVHFKISMVAGFLLVLPVILYAVWRFISPGLLQKEKRYVGPFVIAATALFFAGAAFCFSGVLPFAMKFFLTYKTASLTPMISVGNYVDFCLKFVLAFGAVFELPLAIVVLTRMGVVTPEGLARNRKYAVLVVFVASGVLTPTPDAFNQIMMAVPMMFLFEGGLLAARLFARRKRDDKG